jgi:sugar/nucleoside kinase (ribokinase family)
MLPDEISDSCFDNAAIVFVEGYLLFNRDLIQAALKAAQRCGALIALDLASFTVVEESKEFLAEIVYKYVDILMANEDEARAFTGDSDEIKGLEALSQHVDIAVVKVGKKGSYISHDGEILKIEAKGTGSAVDTTGAGDLWASGFLFGLINGYPLPKCGELGSACGYEVCQVIGANIPDPGWQRIRKDIIENVEVL